MSERPRRGLLAARLAAAGAGARRARCRRVRVCPGTRLTRPPAAVAKRCAARDRVRERVETAERAGRGRLSTPSTLALPHIGTWGDMLRGLAGWVRDKPAGMTREGRREAF